MHIEHGASDIATSATHHPGLVKAFAGLLQQWQIYINMWGAGAVKLNLFRLIGDIKNFHVRGRRRPRTSRPQSISCELRPPQVPCSIIVYACGPLIRKKIHTKLTPKIQGNYLFDICNTEVLCRTHPSSNKISDQPLIPGISVSYQNAGYSIV